MTKKFFSALVVLSIAAMMFLSSCTAAGVECGLIGKWEHKEGFVTITVEITNDDKCKIDGVEFEVESVDDHVIKIKNYSLGPVEYKNLGCDSVEFKVGGAWFEFSKVN